MSSPGRSGASRPPGGMGGGSDFGEAFDEQSLSNMMTQVGQQQSSNDPSSGGPGGGSSGSQMPQLPPQMAPDAQAPSMPPVKPREIGSLADELIKRPVQDIFNELKSFFDLNSLLGIKDPSKDPQTLAKKRQMMQRYNQLTAEQQQVAQQKYQERQMRKQKQQEEEAMKKQREQAEKQASISVPSSPQKGPKGQAGGKPKAVMKLEQDRQKLSGPASAN
jgi:hypothetical protein